MADVELLMTASVCELVDVVVVAALGLPMRVVWKVVLKVVLAGCVQDADKTLGGIGRQALLCPRDNGMLWCENDEDWHLGICFTRKMTALPQIAFTPFTEVRKGHQSAVTSSNYPEQSLAS